MQYRRHEDADQKSDSFTCNTGGNEVLFMNQESCSPSLEFHYLDPKNCDQMSIITYDLLTEMLAECMFFKPCAVSYFWMTQRVDTSAGRPAGKPD